MPQEPVDHNPNWIGLRLDIHAHFEDDEEILRDQWELENPQLEPFPDNEFVNMDAWMDDDSSISERSDHDLELDRELLNHESSSEDGIPDFSDAEMDDNPVNAPFVLQPSASDVSDSDYSPGDDDIPDFSDREINTERSGIPSSGEDDDFLFSDLSETEIDTEATTEIDDDPFNDALSPISSGELEYSPSHSEASSNNDLPPSAFEPEIKLEHVGSMQVVENPPDEDHDHLLIVETPESPDSEHNDYQLLFGRLGDHIFPLIPPSHSEASSNDDLPPSAFEPEIEIQEEDIEIDFEAINDPLEPPDIKLEFLIPPGAQEELDRNVIPAPLGNQNDNDVIFLDAVDPEVMEIEDEDYLGRIQVSLDVQAPLVHGPNEDVNDIIVLDEVTVLREIEVIVLDESDDDSAEQEGMEIDDELIIQIDGLFDHSSDMSNNRVDG